MNTPKRGPGGVIYTSGLGVKPRGSRRPFTIDGGPYRAVVLKTYVMGDPDNGVEPSTDASGRVSQSRVEADIVMVRSGAILQRVPVIPRNWGVNDADPWVPRVTTRTLSGNQPLTIESVMSFRGVASGEGATALSDVDGDIVLVDFIEEDIHFPIIWGVYPHPGAKRAIVEGTGWEEAAAGAERGVAHDQERYLRFAGVEVRVNAAGDVLVDTVGATSDLVDEDPTVGGGQVRVRLKSTERFTLEMNGTDVLEVWDDGGQVKVDLGENATERLLLGDAFKAIYDALIVDLLGHSHAGGSGGPVTTPIWPSGAPPGTPPPSLPDAVLSDLSRTKKS